MSEPAIFGLVHNEERRFFADRWASIFLYRELVWGPQEFDAWVTSHEELEEYDEDCAGGAIVDHDAKRLVWLGDAEPLRVPRVHAVYHQMLQAAWPGYEIVFSDAGMHELAAAAGVEEPAESYPSERLESVHEAARLDEDEEDDEELDDDEVEAPFGAEEIRAWVTIIGPSGKVRHRHLEQLPSDLLAAKHSPIESLAALRPAEVPAEAVVAEGMWIDQRSKTVGIWGGSSLRGELPTVREGWDGWAVRWAERGYAEQCEASGQAGIPLGDAEALAKVLPIILSTKRFDMNSVLGAIGGGIKRTAVKATGCLLLVICFPLVVFGAVSGAWTSVLISVAITTVAVVLAFKLVEYRFRKSFASRIPSASREDRAPPVAGPLDEQMRRQRVDQLLTAASLPPLSQVELLFPKESELDLLR